MISSFSNIFWLGTKELRAFSHDFVLVALVVWAFSFSILSIARSSLQELHDASIGIADEDQSALSRRISQAFLPPYFKTPRPIAPHDIEALMNTGALTFVIDIPPNFQRDLVGGRQACGGADSPPRAAPARRASAAWPPARTQSARNAPA